MGKDAAAAQSQRLVFISHSSRDTWVAKQIAREIIASGAIPFLDEADIDVGDDFEERILAALAKADELVVLLTPWSLERPYVLAEIAVAWGRRIRIIPLLLGVTAGELRTKQGFPPFLAERNMLHLNDIEVYLRQLRVQSSGERSVTGGTSNA